MTDPYDLDGAEVLLQSRDQKSLVLDGEIVVAGERGLDFEALQLRVHPAASGVKLLSQESPASVVFFDLLASASGVSARGRLRSHAGPSLPTHRAVPPLSQRQ